MPYTPSSAFNSYGAGNKIYNNSRFFPTMGPVDKLGYRERDLRVRTKRNAMLRRLQAKMKGDYMSSDYLREV